LTLQELTAKIRHIEIKSRRLSNHLFAGEYHTAFKGKGMSFSEVRDYTYGDDTRNIDWNVSARLGTPFVKIFEEERELVVMLVIDISKSNSFGLHTKTKLDLTTELAATIGFSALKNNDKVGAIFFSDGVEKFIPAQKGKAHLLFILRTLLTIQPRQNAQTNIATALKVLNNMTKRKCIAVLMSDFVSPSFDKELKMTARKHDTIGIHLYDQTDRELPNVGLLRIKDLETNQMEWIDTNQTKVRHHLQAKFDAFAAGLKAQFAAADAGLMSIHTQQDFVKILHQYFNQ
jgi:uncharacterized protein (DUF58 family)